MADAKHSEGPWWFVPGQGVRNRGGFLCHFNSVQRYPDQDERYAREVAERDADGHLIAAAPDLLAALRDMLNTITDGPDDSDVDRIVQSARAAIARAKGEA